MLSQKDAITRLRKHKLTPKAPFPGTEKPWRVKCDLCGKTTTIYLDRLRKRKHPGCEACGRAANMAEHAITASEASARVTKAGLTPLEPYPGNVRLPWRCRCDTCGDVVSPTTAALATQGGCVRCGRESGARKRSLSETAARARMKTAGLTPLDPYSGNSREPWRARCAKCRSIVAPRPNSLPRQGGCRVCAARARGDAVLDQRSSQAEKLVRAAGFIPKEPYPGAQKRWKLHCKTCDSTVHTYASSIRDGHSCPKCTGKLRLSPAEAARIAKKANRRILGEYKAAHLPVAVECLNCGAEKDVSIASLRNSRGTCNECKPSARLSPDEAVALMLAAGMEPLEPYRNARAPWRSRCVECGEIGTPRFANIRAGQKGCRACNYYGYDITAPAILYVLINREHDAVKIGITNQGSVRLRNLSRTGWKPGKVWVFPEGRTPLHVETLVLRRLRGKGLRQAVSQKDMRGTRGATETFRRADIAPRAIYRWVDAMVKQSE